MSRFCLCFCRTFAFELINPSDPKVSDTVDNGMPSGDLLKRDHCDENAVLVVPISSMTLSMLKSSLSFCRTIAQSIFQSSSLTPILGAIVWGLYVVRVGFDGSKGSRGG